MNNPSMIIWGFLFGTIGVAYMVYAKKQQRWVPFISGIGLCAFTYFISNPVLIIVIGIVLVILPFIIKI